MNLFQTVVMALLQGITELFPVSSLGHSVILPALLRWNYDPSAPAFVPFLTLLHLGTATALVILYRRDWARLAVGLAQASLRGKVENEDQRLALLIAIGTVPIAVAGVVAEQGIKSLFASPRPAAAFLILNGMILLGAELLRRRDERRSRLGTESRDLQEAHYRAPEQLSFRAVLAIGLFQTLALLPGISRSGSTMAGGLLAGLRHQEAARFAFLLATPAIGGAALLEVPQLFTSGTQLLLYAGGALLAGVSAYVSARFLIRYFRSGRLDPYGYYCLAAGAAALLLLR
jgi:undecaprenyl-diphosphatase